MRRAYQSVLIAALFFWCAACGSEQPTATETEAPDPPAVALGERLFLETRFAQFFAVHSAGQINTPLSAGDPVMDTTQTRGEPLEGPFAGASMNCRACHLVDEQGDRREGGVRTYADFARRSPIPERADGRTTTPRNSPALVNSTLPRAGSFLLHFDGEFASVEDLVRGTLTGRNFGWLPTESALAVAHIANVVRQDDGGGALAREFGNLPYSVAFAGAADDIPEDLRLPEELRFEVETANDAQILDTVATLISAYVRSLTFAQDANGEFSGSPYDRFLAKNHLPRQPAQGESALDYSRRLRDRVAGLSHPQFISLKDGAFALHAQEFRFGPTELQGLKIFLAELATASGGGAGNCVACHQAPDFTDFSFHNTGASQDEYDAIHGAGAFAALDIPDLAARNAASDEFLGPSPAHPNAQGRFIAVPAADAPGYTDLGLWNVLGNPDIPAPQASIVDLLCAQGGSASDCTVAQLLPASIALFKTPGLRDLGQSGPYLHTGQKDTIDAVLVFYLQISNLARQGVVRNAAPELAGMRLASNDIAPLAAFLRSLNEDYE